MSASAVMATLEDLYATPGKAELIAGRIVEQMPTGMRPAEVGGNIYFGLREHVRVTGIGKTFPDNVGYAIPSLPSGRESFSPDASYYRGPLPANRMRFIEGPPTFAVEVRSENDHGQAAEEAMAAKREDYFQAGTLVVWDVCPIHEEVRKYVHGQSLPVVFQRGSTADAEPAVPGWRILVADVFA